MGQPKAEVTKLKMKRTHLKNGLAILRQRVLDQEAEIRQLDQQIENIEETQKTK